MGVTEARLPPKSETRIREIRKKAENRIPKRRSAKIQNDVYKTMIS